MIKSFMPLLELFKCGHIHIPSHLEPVDIDELVVMLGFPRPWVQEIPILISVEEVPVKRPPVESMLYYGVGVSNVVAKPVEEALVTKSGSQREVSARSMLLAQCKAKVEDARKAGEGQAPCNAALTSMVVVASPAATSVVSAEVPVYRVVELLTLRAFVVQGEVVRTQSSLVEEEDWGT